MSPNNVCQNLKKQKKQDLVGWIDLLLVVCILDI